MRPASDPRTAVRRLRRLAPCLLALGLAGCVPATTPAFDNDPLFGGPPVPRGGAVAAAPKTTGPAASPPAFAPPSAPGGPAALAAAAPAGDAMNLRIGPAPAAVTSAPHDGGEPWNSAGPAAGAILQHPQPITDPSVHPSAAADPPTAAPSAPAAGQYEQLQAMLAQRGVAFEALEGPDAKGVWRFRCGVPAKGDPNSTHNFEESAPGDNGLAAMRTVLKDIDQYQQQGP